jgi:hypothetical protein
VCGRACLLGGAPAGKTIDTAAPFEDEERTLKPGAQHTVEMGFLAGLALSFRSLLQDVSGLYVARDGVGGDHGSC